MSHQVEPDAAQIGYVIEGLRQIEEAGLLRDFEHTVGNELRELAQRQQDTRHYYSGTGDYVARLLDADVERCRRIATGTRAGVVIEEIGVYLNMIRQRAQRDAELERDPRPPIPGVLEQPARKTRSPVKITAARQQRRAAG